MFDFAFSEIALIGVVALVVIGPERLPRVARTAGVVIGRMQRYAAAVKADIAREVELSELRRVHGEIHDAARSFESGVRDSLAAAETHLDAGRQAVMTGPQPAPASVTAVDPSSPVAELPHPPLPLPQASLFQPGELPPGSSAVPPSGDLPPGSSALPPTEPA
jgi:sec-independent protein translocase protein TatB